jgi:hypothetical protein
VKRFWALTARTVLVAQGSITVVSVQDGVCTMDYSGPEMIGPGIRDAVAEHFTDLTTVTVNQLPDSN